MNDADTLRGWRARIEAYLHDQFALELNPKQRLAPVSNGIDFLGYIVRREYLLVRHRRARSYTVCTGGSFVIVRALLSF